MWVSCGSQNTRLGRHRAGGAGERWSGGTLGWRGRRAGGVREHWAGGARVGGTTGWENWEDTGERELQGSTGLGTPRDTGLGKPDIGVGGTEGLGHLWGHRSGGAGDVGLAQPGDTGLARPRTHGATTATCVSPGPWGTERPRGRWGSREQTGTRDGPGYGGRARTKSAGRGARRGGAWSLLLPRPRLQPRPPRGRRGRRSL